jgi:hypothetical protein
MRGGSDVIGTSTRMNGQKEDRQYVGLGSVMSTTMENILMFGRR